MIQLDSLQFLYISGWFTVSIFYCEDDASEEEASEEEASEEEASEKEASEEERRMLLQA